MNLFHLIKCVFGRHTRSGRAAWHDGTDFWSVCKGCGRRMIRDGDGWTLHRDEGRHR